MSNAVMHQDEVFLLMKLSEASQDIHRLRQHMDYVDNQEVDVALISLNAAERLYFFYYNRLRQLKGYPPLEGERFSTPVISEVACAAIRYDDKECRYQSLLF